MFSLQATDPDSEISPTLLQIMQTGLAEIGLIQLCFSELHAGETPTSCQWAVSTNAPAGKAGDPKARSDKPALGKDSKLQASAEEQAQSAWVRW